MPLASGSFDAFQYIDYLSRRWVFAAAACGVALALSLGISMLLPKRYSSTARIVIEPPAGADMRSLVAVSPMYVESLKSFQLLASSDSLLLDTARRFGLQGYSVERLRRSVMRIDIPRDTNVLEITASLPDPVRAHELAGYFAGQVVALNDRVSGESDRKLTASAEAQLAAARTRLDAADSVWTALVTAAPVDSLKGEIDGVRKLEGELQALAANTNLGIARTEERIKAAEAGGRRGDVERAHEDLRTARTGARELEKQIREAEARIAATQGLLERRTAMRDKAAAERQAAQANYDAMDKRLGEVRAAAGYRGERLRIIDPGVVPDRPSSPNKTLNVVVALFAAAVLSLLYLTLEFNYRVRRAAMRAVPLRLASND